MSSTTSRATIPHAAIVLTGGTGVRMGGADKAQITLHGRTLLEWALAATAEADEVVVVGPEGSAPPDVHFVREQPVRGGPAAGLLAGRDALPRAERAVLLAVDMPRVTPATVRRLLDAAQDRDGSVLIDGRGRRQLCLVLSLARLDDVRPPDGATNLGLFKLLAELDLVDVAAEGDEGADLDTWAEVEALRSEHARGPDHRTRRT